MTAAAERMKAMRDRKRSRGLREVRITVPDSRSASVRQRVAAQVAGLIQPSEEDALRWIEAVSEFDAPDLPRSDDARRCGYGRGVGSAALAPRISGG